MHFVARSLAAVGLVALGYGVGGCKAEANVQSSASGTETGSGSGSAGDTSGPTDDEDGVGDTNTDDNDTVEPDSATDDSPDDTDTSNDTPDDTGEDTGTPSDCEFTEDFEGVADGSPWPSPWTVAGGVEVSDVQQGRGRLRPFLSGYSLARMFAPIDCRDVEATYTFEFTDGSTQGAGFFVRQNSGYLQETNPRGEGYSAFTEAFRDPYGIGVWREVDGVEQNIPPITPGAIMPGVVYRVRLRVTQADGGSTLLQARYWPDGESEPNAWQVERTDDTPSLQGVGGGLAVDAWSSLTSGQGTASDMFYDDIVVTAAP